MNINPAGHHTSGYITTNTYQGHINVQASESATISPVVTRNQEKQPEGINVNDRSSSTNNTDSSAADNQRTQQNPNATSINGQVLTNAEMRLVEQLQQVDREVRSHEMAHIAAGGRYITSGANFSYQRGPDGKNYAVGGEVSIDTAPIPGDPEATIQKMRQIKSSALAPASPSSQDLKVAAKASTITSQALSELMILNAKQQAESNEESVFGNLKNASDTYAKVNNLPENDTSSFQIAV